VALDFDASRAWAGYDWVGPCKAALESIARYLALYLGPDGIRVNLVSPGPLETVSGRSHAMFAEFAERWRSNSPLPWEPRDHDIVVGPVLFLLSDLARGVSGELIHVDGGYHVTGAPVPAAWLPSQNEVLA
jgi:enoyl-[acyl-carrier protein] reductase I